MSGGILATLVMLGIAALVVLVLFVVVVAVVAKKYTKSQSLPGLPHSSEIPATVRGRVRPFLESHAAFQALANDPKSIPEVRAIAAEAVAETEHVAQQAFRLAQTRETLMKTMRKGKSQTQLGINRLQTQVDEASDEATRAALLGAIATQQGILGQYEKMKDSVDLIDGKLREAEAAIAELRACLTAGQAAALVGAVAPGEVTGLVDRLKVLSASFAEAESNLSDTAMTPLEQTTGKETGR